MATYRNPIARAGDFADPFVLRHDGRYYLYCTNPDVRCWSSSDLVDWQLEGPTIEPDAFPGLVPFAPEVVYADGAVLHVHVAVRARALRAAIRLADRSVPPDLGQRRARHRRQRLHRRRRPVVLLLGGRRGHLGMRDVVAHRLRRARVHRHPHERMDGGAVRQQARRRVLHDADRQPLPELRIPDRRGIE